MEDVSIRVATLLVPMNVTAEMDLFSPTIEAVMVSY